VFEQLLASASDGVNINAEQVGEDGVATASEFERFQSGVETALAFIEQSGEQDDGGFDLIGGDVQVGRIGNKRQDSGVAAQQDLAV